MTPILFDIETGPIPMAELESMIPPFDPAEVKLGNIKDPEKIADKMALAEINHRQSLIDRAALDAMTGRAALDAMTGRVLAIGYRPLKSDGNGGLDYSGQFELIADDDESLLLKKFWQLVRGDMGRINPLIGFNICLFDLPFLIRRSWKHGITYPAGLRRGRYWSDQVVDLRDSWQLGDRMAKGSLDAISRHLGVGQKAGSGKDFHRMWATDRADAIHYLQKDVELTIQVAKRLGVVV